MIYSQEIDYHLDVPSFFIAVFAWCFTEHLSLCINHIAAQRSQCSDQTNGWFDKAKLIQLKRTSLNKSGLSRGFLSAFVLLT